MAKQGFFFGLALSLLFVFTTPLWAHAGSSDFYPNYDIVLNGFYWGTSVATPQFKNNSASYGATADVRFKPGSGMENWGFGIDFTNTSSGPRYTNTNGLYQSSIPGANGGQPVSLGNGLFGFVSSGSVQFGGVKVKYFFPTSTPNFLIGAYGNFYFATGNQTALGGGAEATWKFNKDVFLNGFFDVSNNVNNNGFPAQTLVRYQAYVRYNLPDSSLHLLAGYRGYNFYNFNTTFINGYIVGLGTHF